MGRLSECQRNPEAFEESSFIAIENATPVMIKCRRMIENLAFNLEDLFEEIVNQGITEAVNTEEAYHQLVEDMIEEHRRVQEFHDDQNLEGYETQLKSRWPEYQERLKAQR